MNIASLPSHRAAGLLILAALTSVMGCQPEAKEAAAEPVEPTAAAEDKPTTETAAVENQDDHSGKVLRHAVFFSFKESSSEEDVQGVADAFAALPEKIDVITDFQWGANNSPEGLDDGFTHCFLLTFADTGGRDTYIPHPAHAGDFADTLRPHMKDVFVFDYWGEPSDSEIEKELKHAVFFQFKADADPAAVKAVEEAFAALPSKIDAIKDFEWGHEQQPREKR